MSFAPFATDDRCLPCDAGTAPPRSLHGTTNPSAADCYAHRVFVSRAELETILGTSVPDSVDGIDAVTHDSRAAKPGGAFVAIPGFTVDGVTFVPQALSNGASLVVAERDVDGAPTAVVPDARAALAA